MHKYWDYQLHRSYNHILPWWTETSDFFSKPEAIKYKSHFVMTFHRLKFDQNCAVTSPVLNKVVLWQGCKIKAERTNSDTAFSLLPDLAASSFTMARICPFLSVTSAKSLVHTRAISCPDYCNILLAGLHTRYHAHALSLLVKILLLKASTSLTGLNMWYHSSPLATNYHGSLTLSTNLLFWPPWSYLTFLRSLPIMFLP